VAARDAARQRPGLANEVPLPDELLERPRAHPRRERLPLRRRLEEGFGTGTREALASHGWSLR
jgi:hypothetical protein